MSIDRNDIYNKFGPILIEAIVDELIEQINELRRLANLTEVTSAVVVANTMEKLATKKRYDSADIRP